MDKLRKHNLLASLLSLLAIVTILMAPVVSKCHQQEPVHKADVVDDCNGCHQQSDDVQHDAGSDCCKKSACACACHAPLLVQIQLPPLPVIQTARLPQLVPQKPPQVYLPIYVPPQNLS